MKLFDSQIVYDFIQGGEYKHYTIISQRQTEHLRIYLTPLTSGTPKLLLNNQSHPEYPTLE
jgi:hypothetical protein